MTQIDKTARWGDLESDEEESSSEEEEEEEDEEAAARDDDEASLADGLASVGGVSSLPSGLETPEVIDLRKAKAGGENLCSWLPLSAFPSERVSAACPAAWKHLRSLTCAKPRPGVRPFAPITPPGCLPACL